MQIRILAKLMANNCYIVNTLSMDRTTVNIADLSLFTLSSISDIIVKMWHKRLDHLEIQNIYQLVGISKEMNFTKPQLKDLCSSYSIAIIQVKT